MLKKFMVFGVAMVFALSLAACGSQEQTEPAMESPHGEGELAIPQKGQEAVVVVPDEVKASWKGVKLQLISKADNSTKEFDVELGKDTPVPGTNLTVTVMEYLPSFVMQGLNITSASNEANNPAAKVMISEGGQEVFKGWLFQNFPETHAFQHPEYSITMMAGVPAK